MKTGMGLGTFVKSIRRLLTMIPLLVYIAGLPITLHFCGDNLYGVSINGEKPLCPCKKNKGEQASSPCCKDAIITVYDEELLPSSASSVEFEPSFFSSTSEFLERLEHSFSLLEVVPLAVYGWPGWMCSLLCCFRC